MSFMRISRGKAAERGWRRYAVISLKRRRLRVRGTRQSQGRATTPRSHAPHRSSTFNVRRSLAAISRFWRRNVPPLAITAIPSAHPAFSPENRRAPALGVTIVLPKRMASLSLMLFAVLVRLSQDFWNVSSMKATREQCNLGCGLGASSQSAVISAPPIGWKIAIWANKRRRHSSENV